MQRLDFTRAGFWKSSYSDGQGECVEVAFVDGGVGVRDSKLGGAGPIQGFGAVAFGRFVEAIKRGDIEPS